MVVPSRETTGGPGLNIFGYFTGQFGLGESARLYAAACVEAGIPVAITDIDIDLPHHRREFELQQGRIDEAPYSVDLVVVNPDYLAKAIPQIEKSSEQARYRIANWFWELETVPSDWHWALHSVDEIMVASAFVQEAFRRITDKPILRAPLPVLDMEDSGLSRRDLGLPDDAFIFLTSFDFHSSIHRKNPLGTIAAFQRAFASAEDNVVLLIKSSNGMKYPELLSQLVALARSDRRIIIRDEVIAPAHMRSLQRCADAYVSLHRAEGFGLGMAECMAMGKPVIATAWSGNMEFMRPESSCLVDYDLIPVVDGQYPGAMQARWADPNIEQAATYMRRLVGDPDYTRAIGERAASDIRRLLSPGRTAAIISRRLEELAAERSGGGLA